MFKAKSVLNNMPSNKKVYQIQKLPLGFTPEIKLPSFPPIPRLYLELLENKAKVKDHLRNLEWEPRESNDLPSFRSVQSKVEQEVEAETQGDETTVPYRPAPPPPPKQAYVPPPPPPPQTAQEAQKSTNYSFTQPSYVPPESATQDSPRSVGFADEDTGVRFASSEQTYKSTPTVSPKSSPGRDQVRSNPLRERYGNLLSKIPSSEYEEAESSYTEPPSYQPVSYNSSQSESYSQSGFTNDQNDIFAKMKEIEDGLGLDGAQKQQQQGPSILDRPAAQSYSFAPTQEAQHQPARQDAPTLKQIINERQAYGDPKIIRDTPYSDTNRSLSEKKDLLFKFNLLRKQHPEIEIPTFTDYTEIETIRAEYDKITRHLKLESTVENWRTGLVYGFYIMEFVVGTYLKWADLRGFTSDQLLHMNRYDKTLYELGEKHYNTPALNLGPELTLILTVCSNAVMFGLKKKFLGKMGQTVMGSMSQAAGIKPSASSAADRSSENTNGNPKPKMKGPDLNLDDIFNKKNS